MTGPKPRASPAVAIVPRSFTKAYVIAMIAFGFALNASAQTPAGNVLFIVVDDLNTLLHLQ